jgi:hypothetical protein
MSYRITDKLITVEDIKGLPDSEFPKMVLTNGYTSVFGFLISLATKDFWTHFMWLINQGEVATQWWWFRRMPIDNFRKHSIKIWDSPSWTDLEKRVMLQFIEGNLSRGKWETHYDVWGLIKKAFGYDSPGGHDFCSETVDVLATIDEGCRKWMSQNCSPSPEEVNSWLKAEQRFRVFGRIQPA